MARQAVECKIGTSGCTSIRAQHFLLLNKVRYKTSVERRKCCQPVYLAVSNDNLAHSQHSTLDEGSLVRSQFYQGLRAFHLLQKRTLFSLMCQRALT